MRDLPCAVMKVSDEKPGRVRAGRPAGFPQLMTVQEVAERLRVPLKTVYYWTKKLCPDRKPVLPVRRLGKHVRVAESALEDLEARLASCAGGDFSFFAAAEGGGQ